jgi:ATP-dependent Clp protease ATP-binding subunit ClpA
MGYWNGEGFKPAEARAKIAFLAFHDEKGSTMYESWTDRSRKVMQLANQEARRFNHEYIGTEHILLGLVKEGCGVGAKILEGLGVDMQKVRFQTEKIVGSAPDHIIIGNLPFNEDAMTVIDQSGRQAYVLNHKYVGTEHILLAISSCPSSIAYKILVALGVVGETIQRSIGEIMEATPAMPGEMTIKLPEYFSTILSKTEPVAVGIAEPSAKKAYEYAMKAWKQKRLQDLRSLLTKWTACTISLEDFNTEMEKLYEWIDMDAAIKLPQSVAPQSDVTKID